MTRFVFLWKNTFLSISRSEGLGRVYGDLAAVEVEGPGHLSKLVTAVQKYL